MKSLLKKFLPEPILQYLIKLLILKHRLYVKYLILTQNLRHKRAIKRLQNKERIKVAFFAIHSSVWKYDHLYRLMIEDPLFDPIIIVCPAVNYGMENMLMEMDRCYNMLHSKNYNVIRSYNIETQKYLNIKKEINPDIIFYTNPYRGLIDNRYYITNFPNVLTCYIPYSACICNVDTQYKKELHYLVWKFFVENPLSYRLACQLMPNKGINTIPIGYPLMDKIWESNYKPINVWKHRQRVKIIWAPHHSIDPECDIHFSNFFAISNAMIEIAKRFNKDIQIAFKPHPLLYAKLLQVWGKKKTDQYYKKWCSMPNTQYEDGEYIDLFMTSDAMIFDSVSFIHEYLFTLKKSLFIYGEGIKEQLNDFGLQALNCHQLGHTVEDIYHFVDSLLLSYEDPKQKEKELYYQTNVKPMNAQTASQAILNEIINHIK